MIPFFIDGILPFVCVMLRGSQFWLNKIIISSCFLFLFLFIYFFKIYFFIYFWVCWVFVSVRGLSPVVVSGGHSSSRCAGLSLSRPLFLQLRQAGATLHRGARASHYRGLSCCGAQAPDAQAQQLWLTGPVAPRHVGSSQTRARTSVPCLGRRTLNHCATREALVFYFKRSTLIQSLKKMVRTARVSSWDFCGKCWMLADNAVWSLVCQPPFPSYLQLDYNSDFYRPI